MGNSLLLTLGSLKNSALRMNGRYYDQGALNTMEIQQDVKRGVLEPPRFHTNSLFLFGILETGS